MLLTTEAPLQSRIRFLPPVHFLLVPIIVSIHCSVGSPRPRILQRTASVQGSKNLGLLIPIVPGRHSGFLFFWSSFCFVFLTSLCLLFSPILLPCFSNSKQARQRPSYGATSPAPGSLCRLLSTWPFSDEHFRTLERVLCLLM